MYNPFKTYCKHKELLSTGMEAICISTLKYHTSCGNVTYTDYRFNDDGTKNKCKFCGKEIIA